MPYSTASLVVSVLTSGILLYLVIFQRWVLIKPSFWFVGFYNLQIQWASSIYAVDVYRGLRDPFAFFLLCQVFPIATITATMLFSKCLAKTIYCNIGTLRELNDQCTGRLYFILLLLWAACVGVYITYVPLRSTGFAALFSDMTINDKIMAREYSGKLISSPIVKYLYTYNNSVLSVILIALTHSFLKRSLREKYYWSSAGYILVGSAVVLSASLSGARGDASFLLLGVFTFYWFKGGCRLNVYKIALSIFLIITIPAAVHLMRGNEELSVENAYVTIKSIIIDRIFCAPMRGGLYWVEYAQEHGFWGIAGIPKLAMLLGINPVNVQNIMCRTVYNDPEITTGLMNVSYTFAYYSYFGINIFPLLVVLAVSLDAIMLSYRHLSPRHILFAIAIVNNASAWLISGEYLTIFISFGFMTGIITLYVLRSK
jgi:hypothetical protein